MSKKDKVKEPVAEKSIFDNFTFTDNNLRVSDISSESLGLWQGKETTGVNDFGNSQYDNERAFLPEQIRNKSYEDTRGSLQPWYDKAGNGLINMAGRAATSGAEGILNPFLGTFYAIKDQRLASYADNPFTKMMDDADKQIKEAVPFYSTKEEDNAHGLSKLLYGNTLWRDVLDGIGFSAGAMATGGIYSKALSALGKSTIMGKAGEFVNKLNTIDSAPDKIKYIIQANKLNALKDGAKNGLVAGFTATAEASMNARSDGNEFEKARIDEIKALGREPSSEELQQISQLKDEVMNHSLAFNMPIIMLDNWIMFGKSMFGNRATDAANLAEIGERATKEGFADAYKLSKQTKIDKVLSKTYGLRKTVAPMLAEGFFQEQSQYGITKGVNDYYKKKYYNKDSEDFLESFGEGIYQAYGTKEGWDNGIIGALSGGVMGNATTLLTEGPGAYKDPNSVASVPTSLSSLSTVKSYKTLMEKIMRHGNIMTEQKKFLKEKDTFGYENSKHDDFINYASTKVAFGKTQELMDELEQFKSMSEDEFKSHFGNEMSSDEITKQKQSVSQFVEDRIKKVAQVQRAYDIINEKFPNASDSNKERLAYSSLTIDNAKERKAKLNDEARQILTKNTHFQGSTGETNVLTLLGNDYLGLSKENKKKFKEGLLEANMNPMDLNEVLDKFTDIDQLEKREEQFVKEYKDMMNPKVQATNDAADKAAEEAIKQILIKKEKEEEKKQKEEEKKAEKPESLEFEEPEQEEGDFDFDENLEGNPDINDVLNPEDPAPSPESELINKFKNEITNAHPEQLADVYSSILNEFSKNNQKVPDELTNHYKNTRESNIKQFEYNELLDNALELETSDEVKAAVDSLKQNKLYNKADHDKLNALYKKLLEKEKQDKFNSNPQDNNGQKNESLKPKALNKNTFNRFAISKKNKAYDERSEVILSNYSFNDPEVLNNLSIEVTPKEYNGPEGRFTQSHEIALYYNVEAGDKILLGYLPNPQAYDSVINELFENDAYLNEQRELNRKLFNILISENQNIKGSVVSNTHSVLSLVESGLISLSTTGGSLIFVSDIENREAIAGNEDNYYKYDGKVVIYDTAKGGSFINQTDSFEEIVPGAGSPETLFTNQSKNQHHDRYFTVIESPKGKFRWIPCQPKVLEEAKIQEIFDTLKKQSAEAVKVNGGGVIQKDINDNFNKTFNENLEDKFFIAIPSIITTADGKKLSPKGENKDEIRALRLRVNIKGGISLNIDNNVQGGVDVFISPENIEKIKSVDDFIAMLNTAIEGNYKAKNLYLKQNIRLTKNSFRYSIDKMSQIEASKQLETSLNVNEPIESNRVLIKFNQSKLDQVHPKTEKEIELEKLKDPNNPLYNRAQARNIENEQSKPLIKQEQQTTKTLQERIDEALANKDRKLAQQLIDEQSKISGSNPLSDAGKDNSLNKPDAPLSLNDKEAEESERINIEEATKWIKANLPKSINVKDIDTILYNIKAKGIPWGAFQSGVIYLNKKGGKGTEYHEAFHAVFRSLLTDVEIQKYLNEAKKEKGAISSKEIDAFKERYGLENKSDQYIKDLIYEEYMADKFIEWKKNKATKTSAGLKGMFRKILDWITFHFSNKEKIEGLFYKIDKGYFRTKDTVQNRFMSNNNLVLKLLAGGVNISEDGKVGSQKLLSASESEKVIATVAMRLATRKIDKLPEDKDKPLISILKNLLENLGKDTRLDNKMNGEILDRLDVEDPLKSLLFERQLQKENYLYTNPDSVNTIITEVMKRVKMFEVENENKEEGEESKVDEIGNRWDINASNIGGFGTLSIALRQLIGFTVVNEVDEFGRETIRSVDVPTVYNGIERLLANTKKKDMLKKLKAYAEYNPEVKAFYNKLKVLVDYNEDTNTWNSESNVYNAFTRGFHKNKVFYIFALIDPSNYKYKLFNANQRDSAYTQVSKWANSYIIKMSRVSDNERSTLIKELNDLNNKHLAPKADIRKQLSQEKLNDAVKQIKIALNNFGIEISEGLIAYSVLQNRTLSPIDNSQETFLNSFELTPIQSSTSSNNVIGDIIDTLSKGKNPFEKTILEDGSVLDDDNYSKLKAIAEQNSIIDETVGSSSFQNADGETVYDKIIGSHSIRRIIDFQEEETRDLSSLEAFKKGNPSFSDYDAEVLYKFLLKNPLLNSKYKNLIFDKSFVINLIDGLRQASINQNSETLELFENTNRTKKEGSTFSTMENRDTLLYMYGLSEFTKNKTFTNEDGTKEVVKFAQYYFKVLEATNTGYTISLPEKNYFSNGKINDEARKALYSFFEQEFNRITDGYKEIAEVELAIKEERDANIPVIENYHNGDINGKGMKAIKFWQFKYLEETTKKDIQNAAEKGEKISDKLKIIIEAEIEKKFKKEFDEHIEYLVDENVISNGTEEVKGQPIAILKNNLLPAKYNIEGTNKINKNDIGNFFFNHLINTWSVNQLIDGDISSSRKDETDYVKRNKANSGMSETRGDEKSKLAIMEEPYAWLDDDMNEVDKGTPGAKRVQIADAQMWERLEWRIFKLKKDGKYDKDVEKVYNKIKDDNEEINAKDLKVLEDAGVMLISDKDLYFDGKHYFKISSFVLTRQYTSIKTKDGSGHKSLINGHTYRAMPGYEKEFEMQNEMELKEIDQIVPPTASKGATKDVRKLGNLKANEYSNTSWGRQHEVPSNKKQITDGTQGLGLIDSEQLVGMDPDSKEYKEIKGKIDKFQELLAQRSKNSFTNAKNMLRNNLGDGEYTLKYIIDKFNETLQESGADVNLLDFFSKDEITGEPKHNLNNPTTVIKFEQLFYAHFSKAVLYSKAPGYTMVLKSDFGVQLATDAKGNIVTRSELKNGAKHTGLRNLRHKVAELDSNGRPTGRSYSEVLIPSHFYKDFGLKPGDNLSEEVMKMMGIRIPSLDKHSMMTLKVVDYLPAFYGSVIIAPKQIVLLSGADFDVDKLFIRRKDHYIDEAGNVRIYGENGNNIKVRWNEYLLSEKINNKDLKRILKTKLANSEEYQLFLEENKGDEDDISDKKRNDVLKSIKDELRLAAMRELGLPSSIEEYKKYVEKNGEINNSVINNQLLQLQIDLYSNPAIDKITKTPSSLDELEKIIKKFGIEDELGKFSIYSINGMLSSKKDNDTGKNNIGPAAVSNMIFNLLAKNNIKLDRKIIFNGVEYNEFAYINKERSVENPDGQRVNHLIATLLAAMTDNAKERLAAKLNLTLDTLPTALYMVSIGMPLETIMRMTTSNIIKKYSKELSSLKGAIKAKSEEFNSDDKIKLALLKELREKIKDENFNVDYKLTDSDLLSNDPHIQWHLLQFFTGVSEDAKIFSSVNKIIQLNKGLKPSISENDPIHEAAMDLGFGLNDEEFEKKQLPFDIRSIFNGNNSFAQNLKLYEDAHNNIANEFFITKSKLVKHITKLIKNNIKKAKMNSVDIFNSISKNILTYITVSQYKSYLIKQNNIEKLSSLNVDNILGENNIIEKIATLKADPKYKGNYFLDDIQVERVTAKNKILFNMLSSNTRSKSHAIVLERILDGFTELYLNPDTKQITIDLFNYLIIKDGLQFKNKSVSKYISAFMFQTLSDSLYNANDVIKKDIIDNQEFTETFGKSRAAFIEEVLELTFRHKEQSFDYVPYEQYIVTRVMTILNDELTVDLFKGTDYKSKSNKAEIAANFKALEKSSIFKTKSIIDKEGKDRTRIIFPLFVRVGEETYQLKDVSADMKYKPINDKTLVQLTSNNEGVVLGSSARYVKVTTFGVKELNQYAGTVQDALESNVLFEDVAKNIKTRSEFDDIDDFEDDSFGSQDTDNPAMSTMQDEAPKASSVESKVNELISDKIVKPSEIKEDNKLQNEDKKTILDDGADDFLFSEDEENVDDIDDDFEGEDPLEDCE